MVSRGATSSVDLVSPVSEDTGSPTTPLTNVDSKTPDIEKLTVITQGMAYDTLCGLSDISCTSDHPSCHRISMHILA